MRMMHAQCMTFTKPTAQIWGEAIREARTELGLSIFELASRTGMDPGHLSRAERGLAGIGDDYRISLAKALGRPVADLFQYPDTTERHEEVE
jgi:transcriptional regulator with XRE-family HTH domain